MGLILFGSLLEKTVHYPRALVFKASIERTMPRSSCESCRGLSMLMSRRGEAPALDQISLAGRGYSSRLHGLSFTNMYFDFCHCHLRRRDVAILDES
jgi:hypothetical protein